MAVWLPRFKLDCRTCTIIQKKSRGCEEDAAQPFTLEINGVREQLNRCPLRLITMNSARIMKYYRFFKQGFLPSTGGIGQQSQKLFDAFEIIDIEESKMMDKKDSK